MDKLEERNLVWNLVELIIELIYGFTLPLKKDILKYISC